MSEITNPKIIALNQETKRIHIHLSDLLQKKDSSKKDIISSHTNQKSRKSLSSEEYPVLQRDITNIFSKNRKPLLSCYPE